MSRDYARRERRINETDGGDPLAWDARNGEAMRFSAPTRELSKNRVIYERCIAQIAPSGLIRPSYK